MTPGSRRSSFDARFFAHLGLLFGAVVILAPFSWMVTTALKSANQVHQGPYLIPAHFQWRNFVDAWRADDFARYYVNSFTMAIAITAGQLLFASLAGYAFARLRFPGRS